MPSHEELAAALDDVRETLEDSTGVLILRLSPIFAAARERLAQLPEKCGTCGGSGTYDWSDYRESGPCPSCRGRGTVYPPALVERIAKVLYRRYPLEPVSMNRDAAIAVLDALNTEPA